MSTELSHYLSEMNEVYNEALFNIKKQKEENPSLKFLTLLLDNNEKVKYIFSLKFGFRRIFLKLLLTSRGLRAVAGTITDYHKYRRKLELTAFFPKEKTTKAIDANLC